ncbi:MAG: hypothetical protein J2P22_20170 [Nocardioides sp.]|nr:hypothetical protein [Nocardioides sp.]
MSRQPAWYDMPQPWKCARCGRAFTAEDWPELADWVGTVQIDPYGVTLCRHCFAHKRLLNVLFAFRSVTVEPTPPGWSIRVRPGRTLILDEHQIVREIHGKRTRRRE